MSQTQLIKKEPRCENLNLSVKSQGFPGGSDGKESACNVGQLGLISGSEVYPGEGNGNTLQ